MQARRFAVEGTHMRMFHAGLIGLVALITVVGSSLSVHAEYKNLDLAAAADNYRRATIKKYGNRLNAKQADANWAAARNLARQRNWKGAISLYERAAGYGANEHRFWLHYSYALGAVRPPRTRDALVTAYLARDTAKTRPQLAQALYYLGFWHEQLRENDKAIAAYADSVRIRRSSSVEAKLNDLIARTRQQVMKTSTVYETDSPQACLTFSRALPEGDLNLFARYVVVEPKIKAAFSVAGKKLCIEGVKHDTTYKVTVRAGLPDKDDTFRTLKSETFSIAVPDRSPSVGFRGKSYVLARTGPQTVPLTSVNVVKANLRLLRINDRNLIHEINNKRIRELLALYDARKIERQTGELVWTGQVEIEQRKNHRVTTAVPFKAMVKAPKPGIYVLMARDAASKADRWDNWATQWIVVSDLGISTFVGRDGLTVFVRSFQSAEPKDGVTIRLIARNNSVLATAKTGDDGRVTFAPGLLRGTGGNQAAAVMAFAKGDFTFLDLLRPAFDLSDRGVAGRPAPGPVDAYLYTERGVYRPGATVHLTALVRNSQAKAVTDLPLTVKLFRPDGVQARQFTLLAAVNKSGGYEIALKTSKSYRTGSWTARAYLDPKAKPIGSVRFQIEDFVPERLALDLSSDKKAVVPDVPTAIKIDGRFLYGAPAADLRVEGELVLKQDMRPFPKYKGYVFGLVQETWRPKRKTLPAVRTDAKGNASLAIKLDGAPETSRPLKAEVRVSLIEQGGRAVQRVITLPVRWAPLTLGIKLDSDDDRVPRGGNANFQIVALDKAGQPRAVQQLDYVLYRENYRFFWYYASNRWNYRVIQNDEVVSKGKLDVAAAAPAKLSVKSPDWGRYRLEIRDKKTGAAASYRYYAGWFVSATNSEAPDKLSVKLDKDVYAPGDTAKVHIQPPFAGVVHLTIASDRILESRNVKVSAEGKTIEIEVKKAWGAGVYVLATAYRPMNVKRQRGPARAVGVAYIKRDFKDRTLAVKITAPDKITPRRKVDVTLDVTGVDNGDKVFVTLAAVDEGILSLTGYKSPDPNHYFFGQRKLGVDMRDDYGRLIDAFAGRLGKIRNGGDKAGRHLGGLDASSIKTVSLFSGIVAVKNGKAVVSLDVPDFNGRLRLMAAAWSPNGVGHAESAMIVRDPVVSIVTLPRFLAPGDQGHVTVSLHNVDGVAGDYKVRMASTGPAAAFGPKASLTAKLAKDAHYKATFRLDGKTVGVSSLAMTLSGPNGFSVTRNWKIAVRAAQVPVTRRKVSQIDPNKTVRFGASMLNGYLPGSAKVYLSYSSVPDLGVPALLRSLSQYPYGCVEQTTSKALPLLYVGDVAKSTGLVEDDTAIRSRVQRAVYRILSMQRGDGSFGLWSATDAREGWLSAYIMDFLTQARKKGYHVPDFAFNSGLERLEAIVRDTGYEPWFLPVHAYALYVLALNKKTDVSTLRYFSDTYGDAIPTAMARAQIAAALSLFGENAAAAKVFTTAFGYHSRPRETGNYWRVFVRDYGSELRDRAAVLYLTALTDPKSKEIGGLIQEVGRMRSSRRYLSTQEQAWLLLAAHGLSGDGPYSVSVDGKAQVNRTKPLYLRPTPAALRKGVTVRNTGKAKVWQSVTVTGVPDKDLPPENNGFTINRSFYTLDGKRADLSKVKQSDVLVALIEVSANTPRYHQALVVDLLPAGFEIENARLKGRDVSQMKWLPKLTTPRHVEPRDDRFVAAVDIGGKGRSFHLAYIVRAVTPGTFRLPAAHVEDMYRPAFFARMAMGELKIQSRD